MQWNPLKSLKQFKLGGLVFLHHYQKWLNKQKADELRRNTGRVYDNSTYVPIEVTDEEYALICKYAPEIKCDPIQSQYLELLNKIAGDVRFFKIIAIIGIIISVILGIVISLF